MSTLPDCNLSSAASISTEEGGDKSDNAPSDISKNRSCQPVQPNLKKFRMTQFGKNKTKFRSFNAAWYKLYPWLEYSVIRDAAYCYSCRHFLPPVIRGEKAFITDGFKNWKKSLGKDGSLSTHNASAAHKEGMTNWCTYRSMTMTKCTQSVHSLLDSEHQKLVAENRTYIKTVSTVLRLTAVQLIAQRGHDESEKSQNQGNFLAILKLIAEHDTIVAKKLTGPKNARYTHHTIQNDLIAVMAELIQKEIASEIMEAGCFAIMVDETKDCAKKEQLSFVLRYVHRGTIKEEFIGFEQAEGLTANALTSKICEKLSSSGIDIQKCVGQCYDGASVMSGCVAGVQAKIRAVVSQAIYTHCYNHQLNLIVVDCVKNIPLVAEFFVILQQLYVFISGSAVHPVFLNMQSGNLKLELKRLSDTRWSCQHASCLAVLQCLPAVLSTLEQFSVVDNSSADRSMQATSLLQFINGKFAVQLVMFENLLQKVNIVSKQLQSSTCELSEAIDLVDCLKRDLRDARTNSETEGGIWSAIWESAEQIIATHDLSMEVPVRMRRQRTSGNRLLESAFVTSTTAGRRQVLQTKDDFRVHLFIPVLDRMLSELQRRFADETCSIYHGISALNPQSKQFLEEHRIAALATHYQASLQDLSAEIHTAKRLLERKSETTGVAVNTTLQLLILLEPYRDALYELHRLLVIACTLPATSAGCERSFSTMKLIKNYLRNRMEDDRLCNLGIIALNAERAMGLDLDIVVDKFAQIHNNRRIALV